MPQLARYVCRLPNVTVLCCSIGAKGAGGDYLPALARLSYDNVSGLVVDGCRLAHALLGKQNVHDHARFGERLDLGGVLGHNIVECERLTVRELCRYLLGERLVLKCRLGGRLGLGCVLLEDVKLVRDLAGKVLGRVLVRVIVIPKCGLDDLGRDLACNVHESREHLVVGELELGSSGSHELFPSVPETRASRRSALFSLSPLDNYYFTIA